MVHGRSLQHHQRHLGPWRTATHTNRACGQCAGVTGQRIDALKTKPEAMFPKHLLRVGENCCFCCLAPAGHFSQARCAAELTTQLKSLDSLHFATIATGEAEGLVDLEYDRSLRVRISGGIEIDLQKMSMLRFCSGCILVAEYIGLFGWDDQRCQWRLDSTPAVAGWTWLGPRFSPILFTWECMPALLAVVNSFRFWLLAEHSSLDALLNQYSLLSWGWIQSAVFLSQLHSPI